VESLCDPTECLNPPLKYTEGAVYPGRLSTIACALINASDTAK
jgi:hypothetical protein